MDVTSEIGITSASRESFFVMHTQSSRTYVPKGRHLLLTPLLLFLGFAGPSGSLVVQRSPATAHGQAKIAVTANLVLLPVIVTDEHGTFVPGLKEGTLAFLRTDNCKSSQYSKRETLRSLWGSLLTIAEAWDPSSRMWLPR